MSQKEAKSIRSQIRDWRLTSKVPLSINEIAVLINPKLRGWVNYYGKFYKSKMYKIYDYLCIKIAQWAKRKYKWIRSITRGRQWLKGILKRNPELLCYSTEQ